MAALVLLLLLNVTIVCYYVLYISAGGVNMEMPRWFKVPSICNAVRHFKRNLKHHAQKKKNPRECYKF